jgi:hypothetical protein
MNFSINNWLQNTNSHYQTSPVSWSVVNHTNNISTKFKFKLDAFSFKKQLPHATIYFHWYEEEMKRLSIGVEPELTTAELYKLRAQELRDTYSYIRLFFSGGVDSYSALRSFVDNNIHLDEIVIAQMPDLNKANELESTNRDITLSAFPLIKELHHKIPNTKIRIENSSIDDLNTRFDDNCETKDIAFVNSLDGAAGYFMVPSLLAYCKIQSNSVIDNCCDLYGGSKVKLYKKNSKWYFYFVDTSLHDSIFSNSFEDFFISRTLPNLYLKTVYNTKKYCIDNNMSDEEINSFHSGENLYKLNLAMQRHMVPIIAQLKLFSSGHDPELWRKNYLAGTLNTLFYKNVINTPEGDNWFSKYQRIMARLTTDEFNGYWNTDLEGNLVPNLGVKGHYSKFYCMTDGKNYDSTEI